MGKVEQRRQNILDYIIEKQTVSTKELLEVFKIKKATLSEDIAALKGQGIPLETPRGYIKLSQSEVLFYEKITPAIIRQWLILLILSQAERPLKFQNIADNYISITGECSIDTLHKDLQTLKEQQYVTTNNKTYQYYVTEKFYSFISPDLEALDNFCYEYAQRANSNPTNNQLSRVHKIASILDCGYEDADIYTKNDTYLAHGKSNQLSKEQEATLNKILSTSYQSKCIAIRYRTRKGFETTKTVEIGLIVYSIEKNQLYLLCKQNERNTIIPINAIVECSETDVPNLHFRSKEFKSIFEEMYSISVDEPTFVRVRFSNKHFIYEKVRNLHRKRPVSQMTISENGAEIIYTDTIRGLADFSSSLRQFGRSVIVDEPEVLRLQMITSTEEIIKRYQEVLFDEQ